MTEGVFVLSWYQTYVLDKLKDKCYMFICSTDNDKEDVANTCLCHIQMNLLVREFWKQMAHIKIEQDKAGEQERLETLQIPVIGG